MIWVCVLVLGTRFNVLIHDDPESELITAVRTKAMMALLYSCSQPSTNTSVAVVDCKSSAPTDSPSWLPRKYTTSPRRPSQATPSTPTAAVSTSLRCSRRLAHASRAEVAVSLNSNDLQIFSRSGADWTPTETLSEVRPPRPNLVSARADSLPPPSPPSAPARQDHHLDRLGAQLQPHRDRLAGPQRVRVAADPRPADGPHGLEADARHAAHQPRRDVRPLEPARGQVRSRQRRAVRPLPLPLLPSLFSFVPVDGEAQTTSHDLARSRSAPSTPRTTGGSRASSRSRSARRCSPSTGTPTTCCSRPGAPT